MLFEAVFEKLDFLGYLSLDLVYCLCRLFMERVELFFQTFALPAIGRDLPA